MIIDLNMKSINFSATTVRQLSLGNGRSSMLSVLAKRTYHVRSDGQCDVAEQQIQLRDALQLLDADRNVLEHDLDLVPEKPRTDVIIKGSAHASSTGSSIDVTIRVARYSKNITVFGRRRCAVSSMGRIVISAAEPFLTMPMTFAQAYGGRDHVAELTHGNPFSALGPYLAGTHIRAERQSPYLYPRNPSGKGYLVEHTRDAVEQCELPNLEDPKDLLTPERLVVGTPDRWIYMPMPQGLGWMNWGWFPRAAFAGLIPEYKRESSTILEVSRGYLTKEVLENNQRMPLRAHVARFGNGAPIDLQLPFLTGDEEIELTHLHPAMKRWRFRLPGKPPRIWTDGRDGKLTPTTPLLQTVLIEPDESRVSLVWRGSAPAKRPYFTEELKTMPLRVEWD